jgi:hypothetical protein
MAKPSTVREASSKPGAPKPDDKPSRWTSRGALITAAVVILLLKQFLPFSGVLFYPFTLLSTWVHEMGHGVTALLLGGSFEQLEINWNASGLATVHGFADGSAEYGLVAAAGLLAPPLVGAVILALARGPKRVKIVLWVLSALLFVSLCFWVRSIVGWIAMCVMVSVLIYLNLRWSDARRMVLAKFLGILFALDTVGRLDYLFTSTFGNGPSDIKRVADGWGGVMFLWGITFAVVSLGLVVLGAWLSWRKPAPPKPKPLKPVKEERAPLKSGTAPSAS